MLIASEFRQLLNVVGQTIEHHQAKPPQTVTNVKAIVQSTSKAAEAVVNTYGVNGFSIQVSALDLTPLKLDQFVLATGERLTIADVVPHHERGTGKLSSFTCYVKGK